MNKIQKLRNKAKISQEELAELLSIDRSTVAKWESGSSLPRADKLPRLAEIFNCSIDDLFSEDSAKEGCV